MPTVFISRKLSTRSPFRKAMRDADVDVVGKSLIQFSPHPFKRIPRADWIFFYSKNAVKFFFARLKAMERKVPAVKWAALGPATAKALKRQKVNIDFSGSGSSLDTALSFIKLAKHQTVLFPRAKKSRQSIQSILKDQIIAKNLVVYNNEPKVNVRFPKADFLVFTSPMNAEVYFQHQKLQPGQKVFSIGRTTAKAINGLGIFDLEIAANPSEEALAQIVLSNL